MSTTNCNTRVNPTKIYETASADPGSIVQCMAPVAFQLYTAVTYCEALLKCSLEHVPLGLLQASEDEGDDEPENDVFFSEAFSAPGLMDFTGMLSAYPDDNSTNEWLPRELGEWETYTELEDEQEKGQPFQVDYGLIEAVAICIRQMLRSRDAEDFGIAILQFLKASTGKTAGAMFMEVVGKAKEIFFGGTESLQSDEYVNIFTQLRELVAKATAASQHPLLLKMRKVLWYVLSYATLSKLGIGFDTFFYSKAEQEALSRDYSSSSGFLVAVFDTFSSLLERLLDCYHRGSWSPLLVSGTTYAKWSDKVYELRIKSQQLHNPDACGFSYHEFLGDLESSIEQGRAIVKYESDKSIANGMKKMLGELEMIKATELTKKAARASRDAPFAMLYYGGSSLAKTTLQDLTHSHFAKTHGLPEGDEYKYTRTCADPYYSGFMTQMWSIVIDDIANLNPNLGLDPSMGEILQVGNNTNYCPPQADLADKGKTPVRCELLQASTNTKMLNAAAYYNNTLAILRRWNFVVTVTLKAQYCLKVGDTIPEPHMRMLDGSKAIAPPPGCYPDMWHLSVEKVVVDVASKEGKQYPAFAPVCDFDSIYDYMAFVSCESMIFRRQQKQIRDGVSVYRSISLCSYCFKPSDHCLCNKGEMQSKELVAAASLGALASVATMMVVGPLVKRKVQKAVQSARNNAVVEVTNVANNVARDVIGSLVAEAKIKAAPHVIKYLQQEGFLEPDTVEEAVYTAADVTSEDLRSRLLDLKMPIAPKGCWYDIIAERASRLPFAERLAIEMQWSRSMMYKFGRRARRLYRRAISTDIGVYCVNTVIGTFVSIGSMMVAARFFNWIFGKKKAKGKRQGAELSSFEQDEAPNPWYKEVYVPAKGDFSPLTSSWKALSQEQVLERINRNVMYVKSTYENEKGNTCSRNFRIMCLEGQLYVTNAHNVPNDTALFDVTQSSVREGVNDNFKVKMHPGDFHRDPQHDLIFFKLRCVPPRATLSGLLVSSKFRTVCNGFLVSREPSGLEERHALRALTNSIEDVEDVTGVVSYRGECSIVTASGHCGSPYVAFPPMGPVILGIHMIGGLSTQVACVVLPKESFEAARTALSSEFIQSGEPDLRGPDGGVIELLPLHKKSTVRFIESGTASVYGSLPGHRAAGKSKVQKTLIHDTMLEIGYEIKVGAPVLNHWQPWHLGCVDIVQQEHIIDCPALDLCTQAFTNDILSELPEGALDEIKVISLDASVNGLPGVKYIDRMNLQSSMGFPWNASKKNFLVEHGVVECWDHYVTFTPEILERVEEMHDKYKSSVRTMAVFRAHQKDEVIGLAKVKAKKTRLFSGGNGPLAILMRRYFLSLVRCIQKNKFVFEAAPGTNTTSLEWCDFYHYLTQFGKDRMIAGDYSKFDKRMSPAIILAAFKVMENVLEKAGFSEEEMTVVRAMKWDIVFALTDFNGDLIEFWGSNPSGHILTVIVNCIANSLYVRYAWYKSGHNLADFRKRVALMTYGDDNTMGVCRSVSDFNHCVIQAELARIGVVYTMADKESESVPFVDISDISFLKRSWVYSHDVGSFVARLEHDSIEKGLLYHLPSKVVCVEKLAYDSLEGALREYFYYGREVFDERRQNFEMVVDQYGLRAYGKGFPTYEELVTTYLQNGFDRSGDGRCKQCAA